MGEFRLEDGRTAVRLARAAVDFFVRKPRRERSISDRAMEGKAEEFASEFEKANGALPAEFSKNYGVFCTLDTYPEKELRGCIGFPEPIFPLRKAIVMAAWNASSRDPRFDMVEKDELDKIVVDVSILTPPALIEYGSPDELVKKVKVGRDGLIAEKGWFRGLLLPQVPVELGWNVEEFLSHTCMKAGLSKNEWKKGDVKFYSFQGLVFSEESPNGNVVQKM
ncbi:MAG: TIGR00296 family protein [Thermoplasmata archaeon]